jgi:hypothetical protein
LINVDLVHRPEEGVDHKRDWQLAFVERLLPHLDSKPCVDDRRMLNGILHRFREGVR